ncbi:helix-turn-helix transcriptional regulator [Asticcacaulis machinosus]|uniref:Autoinducer binding domain-containing protein n=1 Tax=Asticcacaulis machinosus TaxID=2984211 RepID=A0ABT5HG43_9CAUL|nr:autoinducer binding domain-containing protein [Asticcacaulis machinosus]MDC7675201.1 autoinducer binding domain-containing protein [Asticcacaulis machinosus]
MLFKSEGYKFEDYVEHTNRILNADILFDHFVETMKGQGYDRIIFSIPRDIELSKAQNRLGLFHNYPDDWQKFYAEKKFESLDPVLKFAGSYPWAFRWRDIERTHTLSHRQIRFFRQGEEAGLNNGIGIPLHGKHAQIAGVAMACSVMNPGRQSNLDLISAYCQQFYLSFKRLNCRDAPPVGVVATLTPKETEVLTWLATGCSDEEIGRKLGISANTVDSHLRSIYHKLQVNGRLPAVVKGIMSGLINP